MPDMIPILQFSLRHCCTQKFGMGVNMVGSLLSPNDECLQWQMFFKKNTNNVVSSVRICIILRYHVSMATNNVNHQ